VLFATLSNGIVPADAAEGPCATSRLKGPAGACERGGMVL
jgi:hypothetical protein